MQPDPALIEKQKQEQMLRKQRVDLLRVSSTLRFKGGFSKGRKMT
jgi:hypothetical protein